MNIEYVSCDIDQADKFAIEALQAPMLMSPWNIKFHNTQWQHYIYCNDKIIWLRLHNKAPQDESIHFPHYIVDTSAVFYSEEEIVDYLRTISTDHLLYDVVN